MIISLLRRVEDDRVLSPALSIISGSNSVLNSAVPSKWSKSLWIFLSRACEGGEKDRPRVVVVGTLGIV
jgi:hypothetical protein